MHGRIVADSAVAITANAIQWQVASPPVAAAMYEQDLNSQEGLTLSVLLVDTDSQGGS